MRAMSTAIDQPVDARAILTEDLLRKFDTPGPRYTSYPTADRFNEKFGPADAVRVLREGRGNSSTPLSLYVHIPFCESLCYYCACNKVITRHHDRAAEYLDALEARAGADGRVARHRSNRVDSCTSAAARRPSCPTPSSTRVMTALARRVPL